MTATAKLLDWQEPACQRTIDILKAGSLCANLSDAGAGKTYIGIEAVRRMGLKALVWAPKSSLGAWRRVAEQLDASDVLLDVLNPEKIAPGKTQWFTGGKWCLPKDAILICDELHRGASGVDSRQTQVIALTKAYGIKVMALSATIASSPLQMRALGYLAGLHKYTAADYYNWCRRNGAYWATFGGHGHWDFPKGPKGRELMVKLHDQLAPMMVRLRIQDIPSFPTTAIQPLLLTLPKRDSAEFMAAYDALEIALKKPGVNPMVERLKARQRTEKFKVPGMIELIEDALEAGNSVVVLVQFRDTLKQLESKFPWTAQLHGGQTAIERQEAIDKFQSNEVRLICGTQGAGGLSVSLHDLDGQHPRVAFHTPGDRADELRQAFGRVHRTGGTHSVQHIVLAADTVEDRVYRNVIAKAGNIDALVDGDLT